MPEFASLTGGRHIERIVIIPDRIINLVLR
jgi:hypothetical protein